MDKFSKLQRIPVNDKSYSWIKELSLGFFEEYEKAMRQMGGSFSGYNVINTSYHYDWEDDMNEHGMTKFALILSGMLYEMKKDEFDDKQAFEAYWDILDFETGEYDDLFTPEDLALIKEDIKTVKNFIEQDATLVKDTIRRRREAQAE
ncbi:MAG: hypothetical protein IJD97_05225 [Clostridia bacterium]|nr:hypothetical protein [Clostridia bacterium]